MTYPSSSREPGPIVPPVRAGHRRRFSEANRRHILAEANEPSVSVSDVARRHGIARRVICRWRQELAAATPTFIAVKITDAPTTHLTGHLLYRRGGLRHMASHMSKDIPAVPASHIPSARTRDQGVCRNFSEAEKRRIVEEACQKGASVSGMASKCSIDISAHDIQF